MSDRRYYDLQPLDGGGYAALREEEPLFCFIRDDAERAKSEAEAALASFRRLTGRSAPPLTGAADRTSNGTRDIG